MSTKPTPASTPATMPSTAPSSTTAAGEDVLRVIADVESQLSHLRQFHAEQQRQRDELSERESGLLKREQEIAGREHTLADLESSLRAREATLAEEKARAEHECERVKRESSERASLAERAEREARSLQSQAARDRAEAEKASSGLADRERSLAQRMAETERVSQESLRLASRAQELERAVRSLDEKHEAERAGWVDREASLQAAVAERDSSLAERGEQVERQRAALAAATSKLKEVSEALRERMGAIERGAPPEASAELEGLRRTLDQRERAWKQEREQLEARLAAKPAKGGGASDRALAHAEQVVAGLNREVEQLRARLAASEQERAALARQPAETPGWVEAAPGGSPALTARLERRQARLALMRSLIREQQAKLAQAGEVIHERAEECSKILAQRGEIAQAHQAVAAMKRSIEGRRARGQAAAVVFYSVLALALIVGLSWTIADRIAPATFIARSTLAADGRGRALVDAELEEWQRFHEELLADPQFIEQAAEHMKRRGLADLSSPGALRARMASDLIASSGSPGELALEWRGNGAGHAARELDTLTSALSSRANAARGRRVDGAATIISTQAVPIGDAIADQRPLYAGAIAGGGSLLALIAGALAWRRLASAKSNFERDAHLDHMLDSSRWNTPSAS